MDEHLLEDLVGGDQYRYTLAEKEALFVPYLTALLKEQAAKCPPYSQFLEAYHFWDTPPQALADFPPLPVRAFKEFELRACDPNEVVLELRSSSTTGQHPSRILLDRKTAQSQRRALTVILKAHLGSNRRPYLVFDSPEAVETVQGTLTARGAAIRGIEAFASETCFACDGWGSDMTLNIERVLDFAARHGDEEVLLFGFTFLVWTEVVERLRRENVKLSLANSVLLHGGGWKKLIEQQVSRDTFIEGVTHTLGTPPSHVLDYYGMVEQVGSIFIDCEAGHKHAPSFATVRVVNPLDLSMVAPGEEGLIVVLSLLPTSYPGNVLLTEDKARLVGIDNCSCGRKDVAFVFTSRVERAEIRGCGDVLASGKDK